MSEKAKRKWERRPAAFKQIALERMREGLEAANAGEVLLHSERHAGPVHLLLTIMPGMTGRELAGRLKPLRPEMEVVFMSGHTESAVADRGILDFAVTYRGHAMDQAEKPARECRYDLILFDVQCRTSTAWNFGAWRRQIPSGVVTPTGSGALHQPVYRAVRRCWRKTMPSARQPTAQRSR